MRPSEVAQAIHYKRGDNNLILWALGQGYNITLWDENNERIITNSHDYPKIITFFCICISKKILSNSTYPNYITMFHYISIIYCLLFSF